MHLQNNYYQKRKHKGRRKRRNKLFEIKIINSGCGRE
jgi:hypothetical protein